MPQIVGLALIGAGLFAGYKFVRTALQRMSEAPNRAAEDGDPANRTAGGTKDLGALEYDSEQNVYKPARRDS